MMTFLIAIFAFACCVLGLPCPEPKVFELSVLRQNNDDIFFVRNYTTVPILVSQLLYPDTEGPVLPPQTFYFDDDDLLRSAKNDYYVSVQTWDSYEERDLTLLFNDTISFSGFHKQDGYLAHDGNTTFFTCNAYPFDKYVEYLSLDEECFLAEPVQLRLVYPL